MCEYVNKEKDTDIEEVNRISRTHTKQELEEEWEEFKKDFLNTHEQPSK